MVGWLWLVVAGMVCNMTTAAEMIETVPVVVTAMELTAVLVTAGSPSDCNSC